jgi:hypothetical protein
MIPDFAELRRVIRSSGGEWASRMTPVALAVLLGASVSTDIGTFGGGDALRDDLQAFANLAAFLAVVSAGVFWLVVRRALGPASSEGTSRSRVSLLA